jgi:hypothetical protein
VAFEQFERGRAGRAVRAWRLSEVDEFHGDQSLAR